MKTKLIAASILGIAGTTGLVTSKAFAEGLTTSPEVVETSMGDELTNTNPVLPTDENDITDNTSSSNDLNINQSDETQNTVSKEDLDTSDQVLDDTKSDITSDVKNDFNDYSEVENSVALDSLDMEIKPTQITTTIQNGWNANQTSYYIDGKLTYGQKQIDGHWYYFDHNGNKAVNSFINLTAQENKEGAKTVYYNGKGQMLYGQQKLNNDWYCFNLFDGRMLTGLTYLSKGYEPSGAKTVYYDPSSGKMQYGEVKVNGNWMYFDTVTGAQAKNKQITVKNSVSNNKKTSTYYYKDDGHKATGEMQIQSKWKCFDIKTGAMKTGFVKLTKKDYKTNRDKTVYYDGNGNMVYGQKKIGNDWYCFDLGDGKMFTGLTYLSQKYERNGAKTVYYDPASGKMLYGTIERDGKVYTFSLYDGAQQNGTLRNETINGKKGLIFYGKDGLKKTGQQQFNGKWYFFNPKNSGFAQTGLYTLSKEEEKSGSKTVYYNSDGTMFYGEKKLEGKWKWFKPVTGAMAKNEFINLPAKKNEASKTCYYDQNGNMLYGNQKINNLNYHFHNVTGAWDNQADVKIEELCNKIYNQVGRDIHKLYEWTWNNIQYQTLPIHVTPPNGYTREQNYALKGLSEKKGNCYVYAATFAALARNLGYNIRYVEGYVRTNTGGLSNHGWTEITINGATYICDPEAELDFPANISFYMQPINSPKLPYVKK